MVTITIENNNDWDKLDKEIIDIIGQEQLRLYKRVRKASLRITKLILRSLRSRLSRAPYSSHSKKPGPWSRNGGRPSEQSLRIKQTKRAYRLYVEDKGDVKRALPPSEYLNIDKHGPKHHVDSAVNSALAQLDKLLKMI